MLRPMRFVMVGGFLGTGKTTTLARLARMYQREGRRVAIVTNDQADDLVDTHNLRSRGLPVSEVAGACFCCRFDILTERIAALEQRERPDVILAEPVGSCTDLAATVIQPLLRLSVLPIEVAPYVVLVKPREARDLLLGRPIDGLSPKTGYIFRKQLEEADALVVNRVDELSAASAADLGVLLGRRFPGVPVLFASAVTGSGFTGLCEFLEQRGAFGRRILELDYDLYAEGEAELGWLNASLRAESTTLFDLDALLLDILDAIRARVVVAGGETAHVKVIGIAAGSCAVTNLINNRAAPQLSVPSQARVGQAELVVNARVAIPPEVLESLVGDALTVAATPRGATLTYHTIRSFRPGRPIPTHRFATAV